jgi:thiol-disulfide isomerase/thioredoxin
VAGGGAALRAADAPSAKLALSFKPVQRDVEYETPAEADYAKCTVKVERQGKSSGWVVYGPGGQTVRRFVDTNGDNVVDQWRYYQHGLEVYRDIDSNFNNKVDQSRWLNTGGSRWGIDSNEDGRIDAWKILSAEEATREAVQALRTGDARFLKPLLLTAEDAKTLGLSLDTAGKIAESVASPETKLRAVLARSKSVGPQTKWLRFDGSVPSVIPAEDGKSDADLHVYDNAMAIVETAGKPGLIQVGELVRVGQTWTLLQVPQPIEGDTSQVTIGGILMQPPAESSAPTSPVATSAVSPELQKLLEELQKLDAASPMPTDPPEKVARYNADRADLLARITDLSQNEQERAQWVRQMVDGIAAAVQVGGFPAGLPRLKTIETRLRQDAPRSALVPYVQYRRMLCEYGQQLQTADNDERQKVQTWWLKELEGFVGTHPESEDAPDALLQLAVAEEFAGRTTEARKWYGRLVDGHAGSRAGQRGTGAIRRLELQGQTLELAGPSLAGGRVDVRQMRGKVVLVLFWSTWCKPCTEDLPVLRALHEQHQKAGFEIVGVNLDTTTDPIKGHLATHRVPWPQIHEDGGLDSPPAVQFGIISLPTMILVGADGKVVNRNISIADLKEQLPDLLKAKK